MKGGTSRLNLARNKRRDREAVRCLKFESESEGFPAVIIREGG
jgi:hypothetical protein